MSDSIESHQKEVGRFPPSAEFCERSLVPSHAKYRRCTTARSRSPRRSGASRPQDLVFRTTVEDVLRVEAPRGEVLRRRRRSTSPRAASTGTSTTRARNTRRDRLRGRAGRRPHAHLLRAAPRGRPPRRRAHSISASRRAIASRSTWAWCPRPPSRCSRARASAPRTRSSSAASARTRSAIASTTAARRSLITQDGAWRRGNVVPLKKMVDAALAQTPTVEHVVVLERIGTSSCPSHMARAATLVGRRSSRQAAAESAASAKAPTRSTPSTRSSSSTPRAPRASRRASCTPPPATWSGAHVTVEVRLRSARRATSTGAPPTSAGSPATATSSTGRSRTAPPCLMYEGAPNFPDWGRFWQHHREARRHDPLHGARPPSAPSSAGATSGPQKHDLLEPAPARQRRRADQPRGVDLVPPRGRRRALPDRRHLVADRDRLRS